MGTTVKSEVREDDAEINALARKITEENRRKMNPAVPGHVPGQGGPMQMVRPGQPGIQNYLSYQQQAQGRHRQQQQQQQGGQSVPDVDDASSKKGRFGWCEFEKNFIVGKMQYLLMSVQTLQMPQDRDLADHRWHVRNRQLLKIN